MDGEGLLRAFVEYLQGYKGFVCCKPCYHALCYGESGIMPFDLETVYNRVVETLKRIGALTHADNFSKYGKAILKEIQDAGITDPGHIAYVLTTSSLESQHKPQKEWKAPENSRVWQTAQRFYWPSGYYGRGFVQLTLEDNYRKWGNILKIPLLEKPDLALQPDIAARILAVGLRDGLFTGRKLSDYGTGASFDVGGARDIVNPGEGTSKLGQFQSAWRDYFSILTA